MRLVAIAATAALLTACASTPPSAPAAAAQAPPPSTGAQAVTAEPAAKDDKFATIDATNIADAQRAGYKIVNENGKQLYCKRDLVTGTRLKYKTRCLTADEMRAVSAQGRDSVTPKAVPYIGPKTQ
jgi:hypothetical protein